MIRHFPNIKTLKLGRNKLTSLPQLGGKGSPLVTLEANDNQLTVVDFSNCNNIEKLILSRNPLTTIPKSILTLSKLVTLDLSYCGMKGPLFIFTQDDTSIGIMASLLELLLDGNQISAIGGEDLILIKAPKLRRLSLQYNQLSSFPALLLKSPSPLNALDLKGNPISKSTFLAIDGVDDFLQRREATMKKSAATIADLSVCGLDD